MCRKSSEEASEIREEGRTLPQKGRDLLIHEVVVTPISYPGGPGTAPSTGFHQFSSRKLVCQSATGPKRRCCRRKRTFSLAGLEGGKGLDGPPPSPTERQLKRMRLPGTTSERKQTKRFRPQKNTNVEGGPYEPTGFQNFS